VFTLSRKPVHKIQKQIAEELHVCERQLLEAEGVLERAIANVTMLTARRERLLARAAPGNVAMSPADADALIARCRARGEAQLGVRNPEQEATS
jgi:hypothetical protein